MINKILDLVLRINNETEHWSELEFEGFNDQFTVSVGKDSNLIDFTDYAYSWQRNLDEEGRFYLDDLKKQKQVYNELLSFLPKEKRPVTTPVEDETLYDSSLPQKGEKLNEH